MSKSSLLACAVLAAFTCSASAAELNSLGISLGSLGNPGFVSIARTAEEQARKVNPKVKVTTVGYDYDLGKQTTQIDNFIASGVNLILLNPGDPHAISPAIKKAQAAGIVVVAVDTVADGADAAVTTDNVQAGRISCEYIVKKLAGKGNVIIENGPPVSAVVDRVTGCKQALATAPDIKILSDNQDAKGSRDGGMAVAQNYLTKFDKIDAIFTINDPQAIGTALACKQGNRPNIVITSVDGSPAIEDALKDPAYSQIEASASQDFYAIPKTAMKIGVDLLHGKKPDQVVNLLPSTLVTRDNVKDYKGWNSVHSD